MTLGDDIDVMCARKRASVREVFNRTDILHREWKRRGLITKDDYLRSRALLVTGQECVHAHWRLSQIKDEYRRYTMFSIAAVFKAKVITGIINKIYGLLDDGKGKEFIASIANFLETKVKGTASEVDDALILPLIRICRESLELPKEARPIEAIVDSLKELLNKQLFVEFGDAVLDFGEDFVLGTKSKLDDKIFLPLFKHIRDILNIPDNDEEDAPVGM